MYNITHFHKVQARCLYCMYFLVAVQRVYTTVLFAAKLKLCHIIFVVQAN